MKKMIKTARETINACRKKPKYLAAAALTDAAFVFLLAFFTTPVSDRIGENTLKIGTKLSVIMAEGKTGLLMQVFTPELRPITGKIILLILLYFAIIYVLYSALQGISWWLALKTSGQKEKFLKYYLGFAKINLTWAGLFIAGMLLYTAVELRYAVIKTIAPGALNIAGNMVLLLFAVLALSAFFSYPLLKRKQLFVTPLKTTAGILLVSAAAIITARHILNFLAGELLWKAGIAGIEVNAAALLLSLVFFFVVNLVKVFAIKVISNVRA